LLRHSAVIRAAVVCGLFSILGISNLALGQTRTINATRTFTVSAAQVSSTYDVIPQICPTPPYAPTIAAENETMPPLPRERANTLRAGGIMTTSRGNGGRYFPGPVDGRYVPADNQMAVGPNHVVCMVNAMIAIYTKSGTQLFQQRLEDFFTGVAETNFVFDPKAFYDPISKRFFVLADDGATGSANNMLVAVSDDDNPNGSWFKYKIPSAFNGSWLDYPGFGFNKDAIIITGNLFDGNGSGVEALVVKKAPLLTGGSPQVTVINDPSTFTLQPSRTTDVNLDKVFGVANGGGNAIRFFAFTSLSSGTPTLREIDVAVPAYGAPPNAASGSTQLSTVGGRQMTCQYRLGQVVAANTIAAGSNCGIRWYDFNVNSWPTSGAPTVKHAGTIAQAGTDFHMPAININMFEDISVFYTRSSSSIACDLCYSARLKTDAAGQIGQPVKLFGSPSGGYGGRWGDYFVNEIDPVDDATFWGFGMAINGNAYTTQVLNWTVTVNANVGTSIPPSSISTFVGSYIFGGVSDVTTSDDLYYQVGSTGIPQFGQAGGVQADFTIPTDSQSIALQLEAVAGIAGGTNMVWMYNWGASRYDLIGSTPLAVSGNLSKTIVVPTANVARYIGPGGLVRAQVRGHMPIRPFNNSMPLPFTYKIDLLQLLVR
jgi:hypothetical protein